MTETPTPSASASGLAADDRWRAAVRRPALAVCAVHVLLALLLFDPKPFIGGDNYWYMLLGESLREGRGYRDLWLPGAPLHTHYPPLYPLLLAALGVVADSVIAFKLLSLVCTTAAVGLTYALAHRRTGDALLAAGAALLVGAAPAIVEYAHWVLSEAPFVFLVVLALYAFVRDPDAGEVRWFAVGTGAALAAYLTRSAGSPLLAAIALALVLRKRWRRLAIFAGLAAVVAVGWWLYVRWAVATGDAATTTYGQEFFFRDPYRPELGTVTLGDLAGRVAANLKVYVLAAWPRAVGGRDLGEGLAGVAGILLGGVVLVGAAGRAPRAEAPELYFALYLALILLWPAAWSDQRLLLPLLPLAGLYLAEAAAWAFPPERSARRLARPAYLAVAAVVAFAALGNLRAVGPQLACTRRVLGGDAYACYPSVFSDFVETARWIGAHTEPEAVVVNRKPQILYWYGRRRGYVYPFTEDRDSVMRALDARGARYVVVDHLSATTWRYLVPAIQAHASRFRVVHVQGEPPTYVVEYRQAAP